MLTVGAAAIAGSTVTLLLDGECEERFNGMGCSKRLDIGTTGQVASFVGLGLGAASVLTGLYFLFLAPTVDSDASAATAQRFVPDLAFAPGEVFGSIRGVF